MWKSWRRRGKGWEGEREGRVQNSSACISGMCLAGCECFGAAAVLPDSSCSSSRSRRSNRRRGREGWREEGRDGEATEHDHRLKEEEEKAAGARAGGRGAGGRKA